jgi:predicted transposase/invertase (TIGR01784 family)
MKYTFDNRCQEVSNLSFEDGTTKIFLNTKGKIYNVSKELQDALRYLEKPIIKEDSLQLSKMIEAQFRKAMSDQKWRQDVKAMEIRYQELLQEGRIEGRAEGRNDREMEIVLGMIEEGASDEMILKYLKISKERLEQIKKNQKVHV